MGTIVYVKHRAIKPSFGVFDHWFFDIPDKDLEIHPGNYKFGTHLKHGTTKNAHIYMELALCEECLNRLLRHTLSLYEVFYYPFINCETLTACHARLFPVSMQVLLGTGIIISAVGMIFNFNYLYLVLLLVIVYLVYTKYLYSTMSKVSCGHIM
jgi:hypothetical protein